MVKRTSLVSRVGGDCISALCTNLHQSSRRAATEQLTYAKCPASGLGALREALKGQGRGEAAGMGMRARWWPRGTCVGHAARDRTWGAAPSPGSVVIDQKDSGLNKGLVVLFPDDLRPDSANVPVVGRTGRKKAVSVLAADGFQHGGKLKLWHALGA